MPVVFPQVAAEEFCIAPAAGTGPGPDLIEDIRPPDECFAGYDWVELVPDGALAMAAVREVVRVLFPRS